MLLRFLEGEWEAGADLDAHLEICVPVRKRSINFRGTPRLDHAVRRRRLGRRVRMVASTPGVRRDD